jgi:transcriptional regulator with XRE-family HTH domain
MNELVYKIRKIRQSKDLTQEQMAFELNISQNVYSRLERGEIKITIKRLLEISKVLDVYVSDLLDDSCKSVNINDKKLLELKIENDEILFNLNEQLLYFKQENMRLLKIIENLSEKLE